MAELEDADEFASLLVTNVRDRAIRSLDRQFAGGTSTTARRWARASETGVDELIRQLIADAVDEAIGYLLVAIDQEILPLSYRNERGHTVKLWDATDGLAGEYMSDDGWRSRFSTERTFADLLRSL